MHIAFALLSGVIGGFLTWLFIRLVGGRALEQSPIFWALIVGMVLTGACLLMRASVLLVEVLAID